MTLIGYLTRTHFAEAAIEDALPEEVGSLSRALVLVDNEPGNAAVCARVQEALGHTTLSLARADSDTQQETNSRILNALRDIRASTLIAVGGTIAIGQARLAAEYAARRSDRLTIIAVPATLCDFGLARRVRLGQSPPVVCPRPDEIIADPIVLEGAPQRRLAAAAMEVLVHAIEAYASPVYHPPADALALEAARRLTRWLPVALASPTPHREALRELMAAALTAGLALEKAVGGVDALAHPIKVELGPDILHGDLHAPLMAAMADFNTEAVGDRYATMAETFARTTREPHFSTTIGAFARAVGLPSSLREIGIDRARFDRFAEMAANDPGALANPRRLTPGDCRRIFEAAW